MKTIACAATFYRDSGASVKAGSTAQNTRDVQNDVHRHGRRIIHTSYDNISCEREPA
jgi:hypothetical protein